MTKKTKGERAAYQKAYSAANREKLAAYQKAYREANCEKLVAYDKARASDPARVEACREWAADNRDRMNEYNREWSKRNKEQLADAQRAYRAKNPHIGPELWKWKKSEVVDPVLKLIEDCPVGAEWALATSILKEYNSNVTSYYLIDYFLADNLPEYG